MSQCVVPNWNLRLQRHGFDQQTNEGYNKSSHVLHFNSHHQHHHFHNLHNFSQIVPMSNSEVTELTWENGRLAMHELGAILAPSLTTSSPPKATWAGGAGRANETLESIVHQATHQQRTGENMDGVGSVVASSGGKLMTENCGPMQTHGPPPPPAVMVKKRRRSESEQCGGRNKMGTTNMGNDHQSTGASGSSEFCGDNNDATVVTWNSFESPLSCTKTKITTDEDSACHGGLENQEEERETKGETGRSCPTRKGRAAAVHNQSERRRRERINEKMKALQKLVPNANKTDKASMLDEVIEYLKHLQAQVQMMSSNARFMPQVMMPLGMQQHLHQMSLLARMGMGAGLGMGIGMFDTTNTNQTIPHSTHQVLHPTQTSSAFVPPAFVAPQMITTAQQSNPDSGALTSAAMQDPYSTFLAQSMNMELYNRMATLQRQHKAQTQSTSNQMQFNSNVQGS